MLSAASHSLFRTSSVSSVGSDDSIAGGDAHSTHSSEMPVDGGAVRRTRKRFTSMQLMRLEHLYHKVSHPTREQREQVAKEAEIDIRSVTVWFQNKRQTDRRLHRQLSEPSLHPTPSMAPLPPSSPFSDASGNTIHTVRARTRTLSGNSTASMSALSAASRKRDRGGDVLDLPAMGRHVRHKPSRGVSLDAIAARAERPALVPRTPPQPLAFRTASEASLSSSPARPVTPEPREDLKERERALWENMQSSPAAPDPHSERTLVRYGSRRFTLEYACAREMIGAHVKEHVDGRRKGDRKTHRNRRTADSGVKTKAGIDSLQVRTVNKEQEEEAENEIPIADWDIHGDTDTEGVLTEAPTTPSSSFGCSGLSHMEQARPKDVRVEVAKDELAAADDMVEMNVEVVRRPRDEDMMDAAYVLFNLSQRG